MLPKGTYFFVDPIDVFKKYKGFFGDSMPDGNDYSELFGHKYYSLEVPKNILVDHVVGGSINCKSGYMVLIPEALVKLDNPDGLKGVDCIMMNFSLDFECKIEENKLSLGDNYFVLNQEILEKQEETDEPEMEEYNPDITAVYFRIDSENDIFSVKDSQGQKIKTHRSNTLNNLLEKIARILADDLNSIYNSNFKKDLRSSFCYCALSTFQENGDKLNSRSLDIKSLIQWDRIFRFNPSPNTMKMEIKSCKPIIDFFGDKYVDLQLNYAESLEEMEENGISKVPENTSEIIENIFEHLSPKNKFLVDLIANYTDNFSISATTLFIAGKIKIDAFLNAYFALNYYEDPKLKKFQDYRKFLKARLSYLLKFKDAYDEQI
jgi:hypothetical protein